MSKTRKSSKAQLQELVDFLMTPPLAQASGPPITPTEFYDAELIKAQADPQGWLKAVSAYDGLTNEQLIQKVMKRPSYRLMMWLHPELRSLTKSELRAGKKLFNAIEAGALFDLSDEQKARLKSFLEKWIRFNKLVAGVIPIPYNFAVMALNVLLALIIQNRLTPVDS